MEDVGDSGINNYDKRVNCVYFVHLFCQLLPEDMNELIRMLYGMDTYISSFYPYSTMLFYTQSHEVCFPGNRGT